MGQASMGQASANANTSADMISGLITNDRLGKNTVTSANKVAAVTAVRAEIVLRTLPSCHVTAVGWVSRQPCLKLAPNRYCGGMTHLRVLAPSETADQLSQLRKLSDLGAAADHNEPFGDQTWVELNAGNAWLIITGEHELTGASAVVIPPGANQPVVVELLVAPDDRGYGLGRALVNATKQLVEQHAAKGQTVTAWTHGDHPAARGLARSVGLEPVRILYRMAIEIDRESFGDAAVPQGYTIRTFVPGDDDAAWLELNATAFADHPEQGQLTQADLDARKDDTWFDPAGFFVADNADGTPVGFHWTKTPVGSAAGEVYAVGVHPSTQGTGLGKALTLHGMNHLASSGLEKIVLYVDDENRAAVSLYNSLGFGVDNTDVMFSSNS